MQHVMLCVNYNRRNMELKGRVVKKLADDFWVYVNNNTIKCKPRGSLKSSGIYVGDIVDISLQNNLYVIEKVHERTNILIRPPIANLDQLIIVISSVPKPDYMIVDKLILFAYSYGITPIIVVNKQDLSESENKYVNFSYEKFVKIIFVSAKTKKNIGELKEILTNKVSAFAGQSAVGKSALINMLLKKETALEGELSTKINRGKNTTRHSEIYFHENIMIADTSGFTSLDEKLLPIAYYELPYYYPDYNQYKSECKYSSCMHYNEPMVDCKIKQLVNDNKLDVSRYERYRKIYKILEEKWVKTHG